MTKLLPLTVALICALPQPAAADALAAANWVRLHSCGATAGRAVLQNNSKLQQAAARLAGGASLRDAVASAGYLPAQAAALHLSGSVNDAQISHALTAQYCATLSDPKLRDIGIRQIGREVWLIIAAPVSVPTAADGPKVNRQILDLVNEARAAGHRCGNKFFAPVAALTLNETLSDAALSHSLDMAQHDEFDHRGHDGSTPEIRVRRAGYADYRIVGENIAAGAMTASEVAQGWLESAPHCENIMDKRFTQIGIGFAANLRTAAGVYWTEDFAAPKQH